ncbi:MAG: class I SAM-dependent methyltransferase [Bacillota bacterium]
MSHLQWFNEKAAIWDNIATEQTRQRLWQIIQSLNIAPGSRILDVATGTGILIPWLMAAAGPTGQVTAIDFAPRMIEEAQKKHPGGVLLLVADVHNLPFADQSFDEVVCNSAFPHFAHQARA